MNVIFGASGSAKQVFLLYRRISILSNKVSNQIDYFVVDDIDVFDINTTLYGIPVIGESLFFKKYSGFKLNIFVAVGSPVIRKIIVKKILNWNENVYFPSLIDPSVVVDTNSGTIDMGKGIFILAGSIVETNVKIGDFSYINLHCTVSHDVQLGSFSTISPKVAIAGNVKIGSNFFCGIGANIIDNVNIAENIILGAGSLVIKDLLASGTYVGVPARKIK